MLLVLPSHDINITWLLQNIDNGGVTVFGINREAKACHTPRRNPEVEAAIDYFTFVISSFSTDTPSRFYVWCDAVKNYFMNHLFPIHPRQQKFQFSSINISGVLVPVVPLFLNKPSLESICTETGTEQSQIVNVRSVTTQPSPVFHAVDVNALLEEQRRALQERMKQNATSFGDDGDIVSSTGANLVLISLYCQAISQVIQNNNLS